VSADNYWDPLGQTFDAALVNSQRQGVRITAFSAFAVAAIGRTMARSSTGHRLSGLYGSFDKLISGTVIEPYVFWKIDRGGTSRDVVTYGVRTAGALPVRLDYNLEMALQRGHREAELIRAWAGHWELGVRPVRSGLRLSGEYNFGSGDDPAGDGRYATFDALYPAGYNRYGMPDPFGWRNMRSLAGGVEWKWSRRWRLGMGYSRLWLAAVRDGLYTSGDSCLSRNTNAVSDHVGDQASAMATWEVSDGWQLHAGYSRCFPGRYLVESGLRGRFSTPFVMVNYKFQ